MLSRYKSVVQWHLEQRLRELLPAAPQESVREGKDPKRGKKNNQSRGKAAIMAN